MKIQELYEAKIKIISEDKDKNVMNIMVPFIQAGEKNKNGRTYPESLLKREIARVQGSVKRGSFIGAGDHPSSGLADIKSSSHIVTKLSLDEKGKGMAELKILPTQRGKIIQTLIKNSAQLGVSIRGFGTVGKNGIVQSDYKLAGLDVVLNPSFKGAVFDKSNIFESEFSEEKEDKKMKNMKNKMCGLSEDYVQEMFQDVYKIYIAEGTETGSFEAFKKENERIVLAAILIEEGKFENVDEAFAHLDKFGLSERQNKQVGVLDKKAYLGATEMGFHGTQEEFEELLSGNSSSQLTEEAIQARSYSYYREAVQGGFHGTYEEFCEKFPQIVEEAKEKKVVLKEKKVESKEPFKSKSTWAEIQLSGFVGTKEEYQEKFPDISIIELESLKKPVVVEKALTEKALMQEAAKIFTALSQDNPNSSLTLEDVQKMLEKEEIKKADKRLRQKAIYIVNSSLVGSGAVPSQELLEKMVEDEIENLKEQRQEMREKNWQVYRKLLSD